MPNTDDLGNQNLDPEEEKRKKKEEQRQQNCLDARTKINNILNSQRTGPLSGEKSLPQMIEEQVSKEATFSPDDPIPDNTKNPDPDTGFPGVEWDVNFPKGKNKWITHQANIDRAKERLQKNLQKMRDNDCGDPPDGAQALDSQKANEETLAKEWRRRRQPNTNESQNDMDISIPIASPSLSTVAKIGVISLMIVQAFINAVAKATVPLVIIITPPMPGTEPDEA